MTTTTHPAARDVPGTGHLPLVPGASVTAEVRPASPRGEERYGKHRGAIRRAYITAYPDTFFSVPARVSLDGRKVKGYVSIETVSGSSVPMPNDPLIYKFVPYSHA